MSSISSFPLTKDGSDYKSAFHGLNPRAIKKEKVKKLCLDCGVFFSGGGKRCFPCRGAYL